MAQNVCPRCGTRYDAGQQFCPADGTTLRPADSRGTTPPGGIGTLVGTAATNANEAAEIKALLAADPTRKPTPRGVPKPTEPRSQPVVSAAEPRRNVLGIVIGVLVVLAAGALIAVAMRR